MLAPGGVSLSLVQAAIFAARRKAESVTMDDFERATERVIGGLPKTNSLMTLGNCQPSVSKHFEAKGEYNEEGISLEK